MGQLRLDEIERYLDGADDMYSKEQVSDKKKKLSTIYKKQRSKDIERELEK